MTTNDVVDNPVVDGQAPVEGADAPVVEEKLTRYDEILMELGIEQEAESEKIHAMPVGQRIKAQQAQFKAMLKEAKVRQDKEAADAKVKAEADTKVLDHLKVEVGAAFKPLFAERFLKTVRDLGGTVRSLTIRWDKVEVPGVDGAPSTWKLDNEPVVLLGEPRKASTRAAGSGTGGGGAKVKIKVGNTVYESAAAAKKALLPAKADVAMSAKSVLTALKTAGHDAQIVE